MIKVLIGDIFKSKAQTIVNTINCVGVMGKGLALEFKKQFPEMYADYLARCERREAKLGVPYLYKGQEPWILNFPTKDHWRSVARLDDIVRGLQFLNRNYEAWGITSIAVPPLGCGQGQLEWHIVGPTLYRYLNRLDIPIELYAPYGTPHEELQIEFLEEEALTTNGHSASQRMERVKPAWVALVEILNRIESQKYHPTIGRTMFQKIAYVATEEGLPTTLQYTRGSFGPFSSELKNVVTSLVNNGLIYEERLGKKMFSVKVGRTFQDARKAFDDQLKNWDSVLEKITDLFMRVSDTAKAEIVATVLFVANELHQKNGGKISEDDVLKSVLAWKQRRKPPLDHEEIALTIRNLAALGWLNVAPSRNLPVPEEVA
ncbi:MAG: macro domain-containing protein [Candidatus Omnitrophica bacterium]|nr:macro domain-containing protein [Candidatus Omnitrophota bacterium]